MPDKRSSDADRSSRILACSSISVADLCQRYDFSKPTVAQGIPKRGLNYKFKRSKLSPWKEAADSEKGRYQTTGRYVYGIGHAEVFLVNHQDP
jgi:hypothetical protein